MQEHRSTPASSRFSRETDRSARVEPHAKRRHQEISWEDGEVDRVRGKADRGRPPLRNPILLEAQKLARQKLEAERRARESDSGAQLASAGVGAVSTSRWDLDESNGARDDDRNDSARPRHSPIVWHSSGLTAAAIAQAELERFKEHQTEMPRSESAVSEFVFRPSASPGSSPEEEAHILREGSVHPAQPALVADEAENDHSQVLVSGGTGAGGDTDSRMSPRSPTATPTLQRPGSFGECRSVDLYEKLNRISEGTYGVVYRARSTETGTICALKKVKLDKERDGFPLTAIREINILLSLQHPNIVGVSEVVVGNSLDSVFMVMEFGDHDLASVMRERMKQAFSIAEVKTLMRSLLSGVAYLHDNWVLHRDLKTSNILYTNGGELKICDFGLARQYGSPLKPYTRMVVTLWYRAPELLLGAKTYSTAVDIWSVGCIMGELLTREPLLAGKGEIDQLGKIFDLLGTPDEQSWPGLDDLPNFRKFNFRQARRSTLRQLFPPPGPVFDGRPILTEAGFDLLSRLLSLCPERRILAAEALRHPWFQEQPLPIDPMLMPTFPSTAVADGRRR